MAIDNDALILGAVIGAGLGAIFTAILFNSKGQNVIVGGLLGLVVGAVGGLLCLIPLWIILALTLKKPQDAMYNPYAQYQQYGQPQYPQQGYPQQQYGQPQYPQQGGYPQQGYGQQQPYDPNNPYGQPQQPYDPNNPYGQQPPQQPPYGGQ